MSGDHNKYQSDFDDLTDPVEYVNAIKLNREQITKLYEIMTHFKEINHFTVQVDHSSGIGTGVVVKFDLFQKNDTNIDITDVKEW